MDIICSALPYYYSSLALQGDVLSCGCFPFEGGPNNTIWETAASVPSAKNAAGPRGELHGDFIPQIYLVLALCSVVTVFVLEGCPRVLFTSKARKGCCV